MPSNARCELRNATRSVGHRASLRIVAMLGLLMVSVFAHAQGIYYRFALPTTAVTCDTSFMSKPSAHNVNTLVEWNAIPAGASFNAYSILDGVATPHGNFPAPTGTGSQLYAPFTVTGSSFPFSGGIRYDTIVQNRVVYQSSLIFNCSADGVAGTSQITNQACRSLSRFPPYRSGGWSR